MNRIILLCLGLGLALGVTAQESLPLESAQKAARAVTKSLGDRSDAALKLKVNLQIPAALRAGEVAILVIPAVDLTPEALSKAGSEITPLGQLWMVKAALASKGQVTPNRKLRLITVPGEDREMLAQLYFLGSRKTDQGGLDLVVFGKDSAPLLTIPLKKAESSQELPLELAGRKEDETSGILTVKILGKYQAELTVMKQEE